MEVLHHMYVHVYYSPHTHTHTHTHTQLPGSCLTAQKLCQPLLSQCFCGDAQPLAQVHPESGGEVGEGREGERGRRERYNLLSAVTRAEGGQQAEKSKVHTIRLQRATHITSTYAYNRG